jgi:hypothetical protein
MCKRCENEVYKLSISECKKISFPSNGFIALLNNSILHINTNNNYTGYTQEIYSFFKLLNISLSTLFTAPTITTKFNKEIL